MRHLVAFLFTVLACAGSVSAQGCVGQNLLEVLPADKRARIDAAVADIPYHRGLLWRASKGEQHITLVGTYHFQDPRHQVMLDRLKPALDDAAILMVEAGPEEEARLTAALASNPALTVVLDGPTLPERLSSEEWDVLSDAMEARGIPAFLAAKMQPWYVSMMLGISPCMIQGAASAGEVNGLDHMLVAEAEARGLPVRALEPWDTVFSLFSDLTPAQEEEMIRATLPAAEYADDYAVTMADAYFDADVWTIWEFGRFDAYDNSDLSRDQVDEQMALAKVKLMDARNASWIAPLTLAAEAAAARNKGVVAGFGALHLPGDQGVLHLLQVAGWQIQRLDG